MSALRYQPGLSLFYMQMQRQGQPVKQSQAADASGLAAQNQPAQPPQTQEQAPGQGAKNAEDKPTPVAEQASGAQGMSLNELMGRMQAGGAGLDSASLSSLQEVYRKLRQNVEMLLNQADAASQNGNPSVANSYLQKAMSSISGTRNMLKSQTPHATSHLAADMQIIQSGVDHLTTLVGQRLSNNGMIPEGRYNSNSENREA